MEAELLEEVARNLEKAIHQVAEAKGDGFSRLADAGSVGAMVHVVNALRETAKAARKRAA